MDIYLVYNYAAKYYPLNFEFKGYSNKDKEFWPCAKSNNNPCSLG